MDRNPKFTPIDLATWNRGQTFWYFSKMAPTGYSLTVDLDVSGTLWFGDKQLYLGSFPDKNGTIQRCVQWYD